MRSRIFQCAAVLSLLSQEPAAPTAGADSVRLLLEQEFGREWRASDPQTVFSPGDVVRFRFTASFDGYLYVLNHTSGGEYQWLFPSPAAGTQNRIQAGVGSVVPATEGGFRIQGRPGFDILYWIVSPAPLPDWKSLSPQQPETSGGRLVPRCPEQVLRARGRCIDERAGAQRASAVPPSVGPQGALRARELVFERRQSDTQISAPAAPGVPFVYEFRLAHR